MISDPPSACAGRQVEMEVRQAKRGRKLSHSGLRREALLQNANAFLRSIASRAGILDFNGL